jgi:hypothetical protein
MSILNFFKSNKSQATSQAKIQAVKPNGNAGAGSTHEVRSTEVKVMDNATYLASDDKAWLRYLGQPLRTYRKPGVTMQEEFALWTAARQRDRAASGAHAQQPVRA